MSEDVQIDPIFPQIVGEDFKAHWVAGQHEDDYHADQTAFSSHGLRARTPAHYFDHVILGNDREATKAMEFGRLAHKALNEPEAFRRSYEVMEDFGNCTYKDNKAARDSWLASRGLYWDTKKKKVLTTDGGPMPFILVTAKEAVQLEGMVGKILEHPDARDLLSGGMFETSGYFRDPRTGLKCRFRPDCLNKPLRTLIDYKTTENADPEVFMKQSYRLGFHFQLGMYGEGTFHIEGWRPEQTVLIAQEKESPWAVSVNAADPAWLEVGVEEFRAACDKFRKCVETGSWPAFPGINTLSLPAYAFSRIPDGAI